MDIFRKRWSPRFKWIAFWAACYFVLAVTLYASDRKEWISLAQVIWIGIMVLPFFIPSLRRRLKMDQRVPDDEF